MKWIAIALGASLLGPANSAEISAIEYFRASLTSGKNQPVDSLYSSIAINYLVCSQLFRTAGLTQENNDLLKAVSCEEAATKEGDVSLDNFTQTLSASDSHESLQSFTAYWRLQMFEMRVRSYSKEHELGVIRRFKQYTETIRAQLN